MKKQFIWALCCLWSITAYSQAATLDDYFYIKSECGKYLTVQSSSGNAGSPIVLSEFNNTLAQQWKFVLAEGTDNIFYITSATTGNRVLDVIWGKDADGTRVQLWNKMDAKAQKWYLNNEHGAGVEGKYTIQTLVNVPGDIRNFKNLDKGGGPCDNGTPIMIWTKNTTSAQKWYLVKVVPKGGENINNPQDSRKRIGDWVLYPGAANDLAAGGPQNDLYVTGWIGRPIEVGGNTSDGLIYKWDNNIKNWKEIGGTATRIAVDKRGLPWVVNVAGGIFQRNPQNTNWIQMPGRARDIGAGANGEVWIIGTNPLSGGYGIFRWRPLRMPVGSGVDPNGWEAVDGAAVRITVDASGNPWVVNSAGSIFRRQNNQWIALPGSAKDIAAGANGEIYVVGTSMTNNSNIYYWNANANQWEVVGGVARNIAVGTTAVKPFVTNDVGQIWAKYLEP
ncbi:tectonin domain-containing protein [Haliscomenobacter hydrossis]|uniref:Ricin B lectin n=1 Tax=Haliscomenobacter hydrossis (strain ATCC 27775 / DSM 1100 / LMG 10767 / O) TaxID=760192 RepID=F4KTP8_HALH1|nr:tectonin domain-containing protein [Haliscomenobacter hydrossis]AEE53422.1 Ricin B lectin [Haliscomenobacter hydrossis DSM 1100]